MPRLSSTLSQALPWGSHLCAFYGSGADLQTLANSFIQAGLEDYEGCLWILPVWLSAGDATMALQRTIPQVHDYVRTGQLELISSNHWYRPEAPLDVEAIFADCLQRAVRIAPRFAGLRVTGDSSWLQSPEQRAQFLDYEHKVSQAVGKANIVALCTYPAASWSPPDILKVRACHDALLQAGPLGWQKVEIDRD